MICLLLTIFLPLCFGRLKFKNVIFLFSYKADMSHTKQQDRGAITGLQRHNYFEKINLNITRYYMNSKSTNRAVEKRRAYGKYVYEEIKNLDYDAVVLFDDSAMKYFGVAFYFDLTGKIFFCGLNMDPETLNLSIPIMSNLGRLHPSGNMTGVHEDPYFYHTLELYQYLIGDLTNTTVPLIFDDDISSFVMSDGIRNDYDHHEEAKYVLDRNVNLTFYENISSFSEYKSILMNFVQNDNNVKTYFPNVFSLDDDDGRIVEFDEIVAWTVKNVLKPEIASKTSCEIGYFGGAASDTYEMGVDVGEQIGLYLSEISEIADIPMIEPPSVIYFNLDRVRQLNLMHHHNMDDFVGYAKYIYERPVPAQPIWEKLVEKETVQDTTIAAAIVAPLFCIFACVIYCFISCVICMVSFLIPTKLMVLGGKYAEDLKDVDPQALEMFLLEYQTSSVGGDGQGGAGRTEVVSQLQVDPKLFGRLLIPSKDLECISVIRSAGLKRDTCSIYLARWDNGGGRKEIVVFKYFTSLTDGIKKQFVTEFNVLVQTTIQVHPHIIKFHGCVLEKSRKIGEMYHSEEGKKKRRKEEDEKEQGVESIDKIGLVMEYCEGGNIDEFLNKHKEIQLGTKLRFLHEMSDAMIYLHKKDIIHRDLKPQNVLLTKFLEIKVIDFGLSKYIDKQDYTKTQRIGTSFWMAPEVVSGRNYDSSIDVFSFGVMMYQILAHTCDPYSVFESVETGGVFLSNIELKVANDPQFRPSLNKIPEDMVKKFDLGWAVEMIKDCWDHNPSIRPNFRQISSVLKKKIGECRKKGWLNQSVGKMMMRKTSSGRLIKTKKSDHDIINFEERERMKKKIIEQEMRRDRERMREDRFYHQLEVEMKSVSEGSITPSTPTSSIGVHEEEEDEGEEEEIHDSLMEASDVSNVEDPGKLFLEDSVLGEEEDSLVHSTSDDDDDDESEGEDNI